MDIVDSCHTIKAGYRFTLLLTLSMLGKNLNRRHFEIIFLIFPENRQETICMKCYSLFCGEK